MQVGVYGGQGLAVAKLADGIERLNRGTWYSVPPTKSLILSGFHLFVANCLRWKEDKISARSSSKRNAHITSITYIIFMKKYIYISRGM